MLTNIMHSAVVAHAMRACGRAFIARPTFLIASSYKARAAVRGYATATATKKRTTTTTTTKPRATAAKAKKPAAKKAPVKAKAKAKKPAKAKKVVAKKKPLKKPPTKASEARKAAEAKRELRKVALYAEDPKRLPDSLWQIYVTEHFKKGSWSPSERSFAETMAGFSADFKNLSASEKSRLEQKIQENSAANAAAYKKWVESHSVAEINAANNARARLAKDFSKGLSKKKLHKITDDRLPKRPLNAFALFVRSKMIGSIGNPTGGMKDISASWKALSDSDKKPFLDLVAAERTRYIKEMESSGMPTSVTGTA
ncbi:unnamed protein product [Discula destructiva]